MTEILPRSEPDPEIPDRRSTDARNLHVNVEEMHLHASDIDSLRRLAETDPALARELVRSQDRRHRRETNSRILGMITAGLVALSLIGGGAAFFSMFGWWEAIILIGFLLGCAHLLRVLLTGEWSETSWFGRLFSLKEPGEKQD